MYNDYYITMKKLTNAEIDQIISNHKINPSVDTMVAAFDAFELMATNIMKVMLVGEKDTFHKAFRNKRKTIRELVCIAFLKIERYDITKGKSFNYFTTIMLCWIRQIYRTRRNAELKVKYAEKLKNSRSR
jgi:hypothetical protein